MASVTPTTRNAPDVAASLAGDIRREHEQASEAFASAVEHAIRCGELLTDAKAQVGHGGWGAWLDEHFPASERTARGYMRLAANRQRVADLGQTSIRAALAELAESTTDGGTSERLDDAERRIAANAAALEPVLDALREVRDSRLYAATYHTFEEYCLARWGLHGAAAARLLTIPGRVTDTGLELPDDLPYEEWQRIGAILKEVGSLGLMDEWRE